MKRIQRTQNKPTPSVCCFIPIIYNLGILLFKTACNKVMIFLILPKHCHKYNNLADIT